MMYETLGDRENVLNWRRALPSGKAVSVDLLGSLSEYILALSKYVVVNIMIFR